MRRIDLSAAAPLSRRSMLRVFGAAGAGLGLMALLQPPTGAATPVTPRPLVRDVPILGRAGGRLAYVGQDGQLYAIEGMTDVVLQLTNDPTRVVHAPRWSPDGTQIAFLWAPRFDPNNPRPGRDDDIWIVSVAGGEPRKVTSRGEPMHSLSWTWFDGGRVLLYGTGFNGGFRINAINVDGSGALTFPLPDGGAFADQFAPAAAPSGALPIVTYRQALTSDRGDSQHAIVVANADGTDPRVVVDLGSDFPAFTEPTWSTHEPSLYFGLNSAVKTVAYTGGDVSTVLDVGARISSPVAHVFGGSGGALGTGLAFAAQSEPELGSALFISVSERPTPVKVVVPGGDPIRSRIFWKADRSTVLFSATVGGLASEQARLYVVAADGSNLETVRELGNAYGDPFDWRPT